MKESRLYVKFRYMVKGRLISIKVLWESFHPNTLIKGECQTVVIFLQTSYIIIFLVPRYPPMSVCSLDQNFPANHLSGAQGKLLSPQSFQNHSRRDHRQVQSFRVTCQNFQPSSHNPGVTMTCWCQFFVIAPNGIPKALLCHLASEFLPVPIT